MDLLLIILILGGKFSEILVYVPINEICIIQDESNLKVHCRHSYKNFFLLIKMRLMGLSWSSNMWQSNFLEFFFISLPSCSSIPFVAHTRINLSESKINVLTHNHRVWRGKEGERRGRWGRWEEKQWNNEPWTVLLNQFLPGAIQQCNLHLYLCHFHA